MSSDRGDIVLRRREGVSISVGLATGLKSPAPDSELRKPFAYSRSSSASCASGRYSKYAAADSGVGGAGLGRAEDGVEVEVRGVVVGVVVRDSRRAFAREERVGEAKLARATRGSGDVVARGVTGRGTLERMLEVEERKLEKEAVERWEARDVLERGVSEMLAREVVDRGVSNSEMPEMLEREERRV